MGTLCLLTLHFNFLKLHFKTCSPVGLASNYQMLPWRSAWSTEEPVIPGLGPPCWADAEQRGSLPFGFCHPSSNPPSLFLPKKKEVRVALWPTLATGSKTSFLRFKSYGSRPSFSALQILAMWLAEIPKQPSKCGYGRDHIPRMFHTERKQILWQTIGSMMHLSALLVAAHKFTSNS